MRAPSVLPWSPSSAVCTNRITTVPLRRPSSSTRATTLALEGLLGNPTPLTDDKSTFLIDQLLLHTNPTIFDGDRPSTSASRAALSGTVRPWPLSLTAPLPPVLSRLSMPSPRRQLSLALLRRVTRSLTRIRTTSRRTPILASAGPKATTRLATTPAPTRRVGVIRTSGCGPTRIYAVSYFLVDSWPVFCPPYGTVCIFMYHS